MKMITQSMDRSIWRNLMHQSGLGALMDADSRARWYRKLAQEEVCTISEENIHRTFEMWRNDKKMIQDEKTVPDNRADITRSLEDPIHENRHSNRYQTEMFAIKYLEEGTAQITNRSPELFEKMNEILISYCPSALASSS
ncbi:DUF4942 domain-containing protein [Lelliottia aquatilis]|uniref:DUF4942 domain-containing protein n=1 Tax=Lelliottia aquatilis TaxID=2080838 RepID=UPI0030B84AB6